MNAASHNRYYKNVHGHKNNNSEKNLAIIEPLKPPKLCVECFHALFNQNNPHMIIIIPILQMENWGSERLKMIPTYH